MLSGLHDKAVNRALQQRKLNPPPRSNDLGPHGCGDDAKEILQAIRASVSKSLPEAEWLTFEESFGRSATILALVCFRQLQNAFLDKEDQVTTRNTILRVIATSVPEKLEMQRSAAKGSNAEVAFWEFALVGFTPAADAGLDVLAHKWEEYTQSLKEQIAQVIKDNREANGMKNLNAQASAWLGAVADTRPQLRLVIPR
ncbi:hypothetical protein C8R43DRAFT_1141564 [Mycena crocata]|nr:hypothetical protein C8R43DRAFT_1141564 [Mycena crocata]